MPAVHDQAGSTIAVLPFDNLSANAERDYFSRGFVQDVITDLAHFHHLQVISSYTTAKIGAGNRDALVEARELSID
jgi:TolB-like protein